LVRSPGRCSGIAASFCDKEVASIGWSSFSTTALFAIGENQGQTVDFEATSSSCRRQLN
jgi:hypothetical protein